MSDPSLGTARARWLENGADHPQEHVSSGSQGSSTLSTASDCNPSQGQESHPIGHHPQEPAMSTRHPTPAGDRSPHLLTLPPADGTWTCTHAISELRKEPAEAIKNNRKAGCLGGGPHPRGRGGIRVPAAATHTQMPLHRGSQPAACPLQKAPERDAVSPLTSLAARGSPRALALPPRNLTELDTGSYGARTPYGRRSPSNESQSSTTSLDPWVLSHYTLYVCLGCCSTLTPNDTVETHHGAATGQTCDNLSIKYREGRIMTC